MYQLEKIRTSKLTVETIKIKNVLKLSTSVPISKFSPKCEKSNQEKLFSSIKCGLLMQYNIAMVENKTQNIDEKIDKPKTKRLERYKSVKEKAGINIAAKKGSNIIRYMLLKTNSVIYPPSSLILSMFTVCLYLYKEKHNETPIANCITEIPTTKRATSIPLISVSK